MRINTKKSKFFLWASITLISIEISIGIFIGYFVTKFFSGKQAGEVGIIKSIIFNIGKYRLHLHHWFLSLIILIIATTFYLFQFLFLPQFFYAFLGGIIIQGTYNYKDWHKVILKNNFKNFM